MRIDVVMPKMGESLQEGTILKWLKKEGDRIERDEMIVEISTDKVDTEVPSPTEGVLYKIFAQENETILVGLKIAEIETDVNLAPKPISEPEKKAVTIQPEAVKEEVTNTSPVKEVVETTGNMVDVVMPKMGESLQEGTILKWLKKEGDKIERDEMILEISTDKVDTEVPSPVSGTMSKLLFQEGETIEVGKVIAKIATGAVQISSSVQPKTDVLPTAITPKVEETIQINEPTGDIPRTDGNRFYSPLVRSIAESEQVSLLELQNVEGTGADGRLTKKDLLTYLSSRSTKVSSVTSSPVAVPTQETKSIQQPTVPTVSAPATVNVNIGPDSEIIPMDRVRVLIAEHMVYSKHTSAHVTSVMECDVTDIVKFRENHKAEFEKKEGFKLTYTPFFAKAIVDAVRAFPRINVSVDGKNIILHKRTNLSFAAALPDGNLIVPVIKNADSLSLSGLARGVYDLATRARTKKLQPDDIQGGTITLTNVGTFGTMFGTPVINQPQCAIIGVGAIKKMPVVREFNGEDVIVIRHMMYVSITYDHRVIDGMLAGQAIQSIVKGLENMNESTLSL